MTANNLAIIIANNMSNTHLSNLVDNPSQKVSASEAKNRLGSLLMTVAQKNCDVIVENRGEPKAVIISYQEYETLQNVREEKRRKNALRRLEELRKKISERNKDLTEKKAIQIADRVSRSAIHSLVKKGIIKFEK